MDLLYPYIFTTFLMWIMSLLISILLDIHGGVYPIFAWYDAWIGVYVDRGKRRVYVFPLPFFGFVVEY